MPRPPRIEYENARYYVTSRGNNRQTLFFTDKDRERFLFQLQDHVARHRIDLYAWVLLRNHFHLVLRTPHANLSRFMQRLNSSFSLYLRHRQARSGHVLDGRYHARLIESDAYAGSATLYVHRNPVQIRTQAPRWPHDKILYLDAYPWSSYPVYLGKKMFPEWMSDSVWKSYGTGIKEARRRYRTCLYASLRKDDTLLREIMGASPYAIGSRAFREKIHTELLERRAGKAGDADLMLPRMSVPLAAIDDAVHRVLGVDPGELKRHGRGRSGTAKTVAVELAVRYSGQTFRAIGAYYGNMTGQAVAMTRRRVRLVQGIDWADLERGLKSACGASS